MESLALMVAVILGFTIFGGPLALYLSRKLTVIPKPSYIKMIAASILAIIAFFNGLNILLVPVAIGGKLMALIGFTASLFAFYNIAQWLKAVREADRIA